MCKIDWNRKCSSVLYYFFPRDDSWRQLQIPYLAHPYLMTNTYLCRDMTVHETWRTWIFFHILAFTGNQFMNSITYNTDVLTLSSKLMYHGHILWLDNTASVFYIAMHCGQTMLLILSTLSMHAVTVKCSYLFLYIIQCIFEIWILMVSIYCRSHITGHVGLDRVQKHHCQDPTYHFSYECYGNDADELKARSQKNLCRLIACFMNENRSDFFSLGITVVWYKIGSFTYGLLSIWICLPVITFH